MIDKFPEHYLTSTLESGKGPMKRELSNYSKLQKFDTRADARKVIEKLLRTNKVVFDTFGPYLQKHRRIFLEVEKNLGTKIHRHYNSK
ncbi:MAG: hypothetical protein IPN18_14560 [Ignavibacteriales bacterium]|nr:hypothetical protein [Ignavibacteriales bacterium]